MSHVAHRNKKLVPRGFAATVLALIFAVLLATPSYAAATIGWPLESADSNITDDYGMRIHPISGVEKMHNGTDFGGGAMTPIMSVADGVVADLSAEDNGGYGVYVDINHDVGGTVYTSRYAHMTIGSLLVNIGDTVKMGQQIGGMGTTGASTGNHLHLEILINGEFTDPIEFLRGNLAVTGVPTGGETPGATEAPVTGEVVNLVGEFELTGMKAQQLIASGQQQIGIVEPLNAVDDAHATEIADKMNLSEADTINPLRVGIAVLGYLILLWALLLLLAFLLDRSSGLFSNRALRIVSFGLMTHAPSNEERGQKIDGVRHLSTGSILTRVALLVLLAILVTSGVVYAIGEAFVTFLSGL